MTTVPTPRSARTSPATRRPLWRRVLRSRLLWAALGLGALGAFIAPEIVVRRARDDATRCLERARQPRSAKLPECSPLVRGFDFPTQFSYTRHDATYRAEELLARVAINRYLDAAIGDPDPARLATTALAVKKAQEMVENGSRRIWFEDLGSAVGSPHLGKLASSLGDRATLIGSPEYFGLWYNRRDTLEAALIEADFEEVDFIASRYASWSPSDADLVSAVGATLCITSPSDGYGMLEKIPAHRAEKRYENMQRNYGEVHAIVSACAAKVGLPPPALPTDSGAGIADLPSVRRLTELRLTVPGDDRQRGVRRAIDYLQRRGSEPVDRDQPHARAMLLAAVLVLSNEPLEPSLIVDIATPRVETGEGPLAPRAASLRTALVRPMGLYPVVPASWLSSGGRILAELSRRAGGSERGVLEHAAGGLFTLAAIEHAGDGRVHAAVEAADDGSRWTQATPALGLYSRVSAAYVAGDPTRALKLLDDGRDAARDATEDLEIALTTLEALVAASAGDRDRAARIAAELPAVAESAADPDLAISARWVALALGAAAPAPSPAPMRLTAWTGQADRASRYREHGDRALETTFAAWSEAFASTPEVRRAFRYHLFERRGDIPALGLPALVASARLLDPTISSEGVETWLDAFSAIDARRMRLRSYAWMRMEAARIRGDRASERAWSDRLDVLRAVASQEEDLELTRFLRF